MKRGFWVVLTLLAVVLGSTAVSAAAGWGSFKGFPVVRLVVDGREVVSDVPAVNFYGRTLVPLRVVSERLGASIAWDPATGTASVTTPKPAPLYTTWGLSEVEVEDALKWARAGKGFGFWKVLPMYCRYISRTVGIDLFTPWASVVLEALSVYNSNGQLDRTTADLAQVYANRLYVRVYAWSTLSGTPVSAVIVQGHATYEPLEVMPPYEWSDKDGTHTMHGFIFDTSALDRVGYITVKATIAGQEYVYSWDLSTLK